MGTINIRRAELEDVEAIAHFNSAMAYETEGKALLTEVITAGVRRLLDTPELGFYLMAEVEGDVAGSLMITTEWSDWRNGIFWWVQSVYVRPEYRRQGVYRSLYQFVKHLAAEDAGVCGFRLYVERDNTKAQQTYASLGMEKTPYLLFEEIMPGIAYLEDAG